MSENSRAETNHPLNCEDIRCLKCGKSVAKKLAFGQHLQIKCPRCGKLNFILENMAEQVIITDPEGKILHINKAVENVTGYSIEEAVGKKPSDLWGNNMPQEFYQDLWKAIKEDKKTTSVSLTNKTKSGQFYKIDLTISPIIDTKGAVVFYIGIENNPQDIAV